MKRHAISAKTSEVSDLEANSSASHWRINSNSSAQGCCGSTWESLPVPVLSHFQFRSRSSMSF